MTWSAFFLSQMWALPYLIVYLAGIILSIVFWQRHPPVSILSLFAFLLLMLNLLIGSGLQFWMMAGRESGSFPQDIGRVMGIMGLLRTVLGTAGWALLLIALFGWRSAPTSDQRAV